MAEFGDLWESIYIHAWLDRCKHEYGFDLLDRGKWAACGAYIYFYTRIKVFLDYIVLYELVLIDVINVSRASVSGS